VAGTATKPAITEKNAATSKTAADCKTVITKAQFEKLANGLTPNMTPQVKKQLAGVLPRVVAMSNAAEKKGLDKTPAFKETMKFYRMQILTTALQRSIQEEAAKVPPEDIAKYYKEQLVPTLSAKGQSAPPLDQVTEQLGHERIDHGSGLIEEHAFRPCRQGAGNGHRSFHSCRQVGRQEVTHFLYAHHIQQAVDDLKDLLFAEFSMLAQWKGDILTDGK